MYSHPLFLQTRKKGNVFRFPLRTVGNSTGGVKGKGRPLRWGQQGLGVVLGPKARMRGYPQGFLSHAHGRVDEMKLHQGTPASTWYKRTKGKLVPKSGDTAPTRMFFGRRSGMLQERNRIPMGIISRDMLFG